MKSNHLPLICILLFFLVSAASAQTVEKRYFRCLAWDQDISGLFVTQSELPPPPTPDNPNPAPDPNFKEQQLIIPGVSRSRIYSYQPDKPVKIIRHAQNKIILISTLDMRTAPNLTLLFFIPGQDLNTMNVRVIDDSVETFPGGAVEILNYSHLSPTVVLETTSGKQSIQIAPGSLKIVPLTFAPNTTARVSVWAPGKTKSTFSTNWDLFPTNRYTAFLVDNPNDKTDIKYTRVADTVTYLQSDMDRLKKADDSPTGQ